MPLRRFLVRNPAQHAEANQFLQALREQMPGNAQRRLKALEPPGPQKTFAQDQQAPAIADHRDRAGQGTRLLLEFVPLHCLSWSLSFEIDFPDHSKLELSKT